MPFTQTLGYRYLALLKCHRISVYHTVYLLSYTPKTEPHLPCSFLSPHSSILYIYLNILEIKYVFGNQNIFRMYNIKKIIGGKSDLEIDIAIRKLLTIFSQKNRPKIL